MIITHNVSATSKRSNHRTIILIVRGLGHCVTSSFAALLRTLDTNQTAGFPIWIFILVVGLQLWFNSKIEVLLYAAARCLKPAVVTENNNDGKATPVSIGNSGLSALSSENDPNSKLIFVGSLKPAFPKPQVQGVKIFASVDKISLEEAAE